MDEDRDAKVAAEYVPQWKEAEATLEKIENGEQGEFKNHTELATHTRCGYRTSMRYGFLTLKEFSSMFGVESKSIPSLKVLDRYSQCGTRLLKGVAFTPMAGDEYKFRMLEQFWETCTVKDKSMMRASDRLREKQPDDFFLGEAKLEAASSPAALVDRNHCT